MKKLAILIIVLFVSAGCSVLKAKNPVCVTEEPSVLCAAADRLGVSLDNVGLTLKLGNIGGLSRDYYSAQTAFDYLEEAKVFVQTHENLTYGDFVKEVIDRFLNLDPAIQALFMIVQDDYELNVEELEKEPLTEYDYYLVLTHIEKQKQLVYPFMR